ncbi:MAG: hypothetical protein ACE5I2_12045 [Anaerolineae bacterium]
MNPTIAIVFVVIGLALLVYFYAPWRFWKRAATENEKALDESLGTRDQPIRAKPDLYIESAEHEYNFAKPGTKGHPRSEAALSLGVYADIHATGTTRLECIELEVLGQRISSDWQPNMVMTTIPTGQYVYFEIPGWVNPGEHHVKLIAFAEGKWWSSREFIITFPSREAIAQ